MYSLLQYVQLTEHIYLTNQGNVLGRLVSLNDVHVHNPNLWFCDILAGVAGSCVTLLDDILISHLLCVRAIHLRKYVKAFNYQCILVIAVCKVLRAQQDFNWILPVIMTVCLDLCMVAQKADAAIQSRGRILQKAAENLLTYFNIRDSTTEENSKKPGVLNSMNHLICMYSKIECQSMIRAVEPALNPAFSYITQQVSFKCFTGAGRLAMLQANVTAADNHFSCYALSFKNKRVTLTYLLPLQMLLDYIPAQQLLEKYKLSLFWHLMTTVRDGKLKDFEEIVHQNHQIFDNMGLFVTLENLRIIAYRNMLKKVYLGMGATVGASETQYVITNMIFNNNIVYILNQRQMVIYRRNNVLPRSSKMHYHG